MVAISEWARLLAGFVPRPLTFFVVIALLLIGMLLANSIILLPLKLLSWIKASRKPDKDPLEDLPRAQGPTAPGVWIPPSNTTADAMAALKTPAPAATPLTPGETAAAEAREEARARKLADDEGYAKLKEAVAHRVAALCIQAEGIARLGPGGGIPFDIWNRAINAWAVKERLAGIPLVQEDGTSDMEDELMSREPGPLRTAAAELADALSNMPHEKVLQRLTENKQEQLRHGWARRLQGNEWHT